MHSTTANPRIPLRSRTLILLTVLAGLVFTACGGGDGFSVGATQDPTAVQEQPEQEPTTAPEPEPEPTEEPTVAPEPEPVDFTEFCLAAAKVGEAGEILELIDSDVPDQLEFGFIRMRDAIDAAIPVAPEGGPTEILTQAKAEWDPIVNVLDVISWDLANAQPETIENLIAREETVEPLFDRLETDLTPFLEAECGVSADQIVENAQDTYGIFFPPVTLEPTPEPEAPTPEPATDDVVEHFDDTGSIMVRTPAAWTDAETTQPDGGIIRLVVAESVQGYNESWAVPGASIAWIPGAEGVSDFDLIEMADAFSQCIFATTDSYSDPLYEGTIETFTDCGSSGTHAAVLIARSDELPGGFIAVEVQFAPGDTSALQTVLDSFVVNPSV